jgi:cobalamin-dependent methionine synthase I
MNLAEIPWQGIYRRLGFRKAATRMTSAQREETEKHIRRACDLIRLRGAILQLPVRITVPDKVALTDNVTWTSKDLVKFLRDSHAIYLMGVTGGNEIMEAIHADMEADHTTHAVILDAAASEIVDAGLDWIMAYLRQSLQREGRTLTKTRYSAGYGDLPLSHQRDVHRLLGLDRLGVSITETCILVPEKTVTAVTGVKAIPLISRDQ